ncbi:MAG: ABC transporter permease subunit [Finegoldia sp.]|nr:ABC transporter permease subunit [Finegoldia sp.]
MKKRLLKHIGLVAVFIMTLQILISPFFSMADGDSLVVGMEANYAPFNWAQATDENGAVEISNSPGEYANGYDVQIAKKIAESLGKDLKIQKLEWDGLAPALMSGKIDAIIAGMSPTAERKKEIDFSDNYYSSDLVIVLSQNNKYANSKSLEDFKGARITGQLNTFHYDVLDQIPGVDKQDAMESFPSMISAVLANKIDGYISEKPGAMSAVASNPSLTYVEFEKGKGFETSSEDTSIAVGLQKGSDLTNGVNEALSKIDDKERESIMSDMVKLNLANENPDTFWSKVKGIFSDYGSLFIKGAGMTLLIASVSTIIGFIIGIIVEVIREIRVNKEKNALGFYIQKVVKFILTAYVEIFRGTPMMVQAMLIYFGSKMYLNIDLSAITAALLIVSINTGAYLAEVVKGGIKSVDDGQMEACKAIGMTQAQAMKNVILPQAIRNIIPTIGNEFVINIKDTSVLNVISVTELFFIAKSVAGSTYNIFETYTITCIIYFILTFTVTRILMYIEKKYYNRTYIMESSTGGMTNE